MQREYRIHPSIGIARVGDSPDDYFVGPEVPGLQSSLNKPDAPPSPNETYKDKKGRIKRQGARFRIYEYTLNDARTPTKIREITAADAQIQWEVHLANRKAAAPQFPKGNERRNKSVPENKLIIDAGSQKISGPKQNLKRLQGRFMDAIEVPLGNLLRASVNNQLVFRNALIAPLVTFGELWRSCFAVCQVDFPLNLRVVGCDLSDLCRRTCVVKRVLVDPKARTLPLNAPLLILISFVWGRRSIRLV